ncbi:hypothetical protein GCM10023320_36890 [Pseudonocardia adelaidensis]|uniref:Uncharacterized protein n=1 Tax=Pseudonocardia adelaidensis TaxID=648754 RepID=A0ABP9NK69_9PSEU
MKAPGSTNARNRAGTSSAGAYTSEMVVTGRPLGPLAERGDLGIEMGSHLRHPRMGQRLDPELLGQALHDHQ